MSPARLVSDPVISPAERDEVVDPRRPSLCPGLAMVEVAVDGRHPTTRKDAVALASLDVASLGGGRPAAGDAVVDDLAGIGIGQGPPPLGAVLTFGDLAGDVGDHRSVAG